MHTVDRHGVHIEQCGRCHGIFLDHGELEAIGNAERRYYAAAPPMHGGHRVHADSPRPYRGGFADSPRGYRGYPDSPRPHRGHGQHRDSPPPYHGSHGSHGSHDRDSPPPYGGGHYKKRRQKSFLEQLFD